MGSYKLIKSYSFIDLEPVFSLNTVRITNLLAPKRVIRFGENLPVIVSFLGTRFRSSRRMCSTKKVFLEI